MSDKAGNCLIAQALQCFVAEKREEAAAREYMAKTTIGSMFGDIFKSNGSGNNVNL